MLMTYLISCHGSYWAVVLSIYFLLLYTEHHIIFCLIFYERSKQDSARKTFSFKNCYETFHIIGCFWQAHNSTVLGVAEMRINSLNIVPQEENK
jgi:hypothetical protein